MPKPTQKPEPVQPYQPQSSQTELPAEPTKKSHKKVWIILGCIALAVIVVVVAIVLLRKPAVAPSHTNSTSNATTAATTSLVLDSNKNYGNKYANGILPVGDNKYVMDGAKQGYVFLCHKPDPNGGGASIRGPWFINNNTEYDVNKKVAVEGSVPWQGNYNMSLSGDKRTITTNDLPHNHNTGVFPIGKTDPAYQYDRNPNSIAAQSLTYSLNANPTTSSQPNCLGGESGVMTTGVALFDAFDAGGRDAGAWEVQDGCDGHPQGSDEYHYHTLSKCIKDESVQTVIGYALDGFPITGPKVGENNILTTSDLDECHGITSTINLDGKQVTTYHYVMTQDFPYSVSCFRSVPIQAPGIEQHDAP